MATGDEQSKQDASAADAAVAQEKYDSQKTGDPIGDADLRATLGVSTTPQEQQQLDDQRFELAFSPNIVARERFEESNPDGAASAQHAADFAKYTADVQKANIDRDPAAFVAAREAEGRPATPDDIAKFENPTQSDVLGASRQSQLLGVEIPVDSALATQVTAVLGGMSPGHVAPTNTLADDATGPSPERVEALAKFQDDINKATVDRDPEAFARAARVRRPGHDTRRRRQVREPIDNGGVDHVAQRPAAPRPRHPGELGTGAAGRQRARRHRRGRRRADRHDGQQSRRPLDRAWQRFLAIQCRFGNRAGRPR